MEVGTAALYALVIFVFVIAVLGVLALLMTLFRYVSNKLLSGRKSK